MTSIEWVKNADGSQGLTWNPIRGCTRVSPGCGGPGPHGGCYAEGIAARFSGPGQPYEGLAVMKGGKPRWTGKLAFVESALLLPLRRKKPTTWFVNSMSDLFHESVPDAWIDRVFAVMALCPQHTFQVLTKRSARMRAYMSGCEMPTGDIPLHEPWVTQWHRRDGVAAAMLDIGRKYPGTLGRVRRLPLPNVWLGVSAEDQRRADERVPDLLATPAAVRFVSAEPLLGPIDFGEAWHGEDALDSECWGECGWCEKGYPPLHNCQRHNGDWEKGRSGLDWVIVGGESGPGARPMHPEWARLIRDACASAGVPFHFKQHGAWAPLEADVGEWPTDGETLIRLGWDGTREPDGWPMQRVGKKVAGRLLDGVTHDAMPSTLTPGA